MPLESTNAQQLRLGGQQSLPQQRCDAGQQVAAPPVAVTPHAVVPDGQAQEPSGLHVEFGGQQLPKGAGAGARQHTVLGGQQSSAPGVGNWLTIPHGVDP